MKHIAITKYKFFGWIVCQLKLAANNSFKVSNAAEIPVEQLDTQTLYTKGRITGVDVNGNTTPERIPGFYLRDAVSMVPAGEHVYTTQEDSEWWCIDAKLNHAQLPTTQIFRLNNGQSTDLPVGTRVILCEGTLSVGGGTIDAPTAAFINSAPKNVTAVGDCYGYLIDRERG